MSVTRERLDEIAEEYHNSAQVPDKFIEDALQVHSLAWIGEQLETCRSVLELGFGEGIVTDFLVRSGKELTVLEGSALLAEKVARLYGDRVRCVRTMFEDYRPTERVDAVLASHVLEHVDDPVALLTNMRDWIKPGGHVVVIVPNSESIHRQLAVQMGLQPALDSLSPRDLLVGHRRVYSLVRLIADVESSGFRIRRTHGFFFKPLPNGMMLQFSPELIEAMNKIAASMPPEWTANLGLVASILSPEG